MMVNSQKMAWERQEEQLRSLDLNAVIPQLWPEARAQSDGVGVTQWKLSGEFKINVLHDGKGFVAWDGRTAGGRVNSRGPSKGRYAGMLVQAVEGGSFPDAMRRLKAAGMLSDEFVARQSARVPRIVDLAQKKAPFRWIYDYHRPYQPIHDYLVVQRGLPESVVKAAWDQGQIQKGYGPVNGHYILFPCRDWSQPNISPQGPRPTGALKRWADPTPPQNPDYVKMAMAGTDKKSGWWQFSQGNTPKEIVVITEQPIDALSVMAAAKRLDRHDQLAVIGFGGTGGVTEKLVATGTHVIIATDHDPAGLGYATEIESLAHRLPGIQSVTRCLPPGGLDWNDWWQTHPQAATQALGATLASVLDHGKIPSPFARRQNSDDLAR